MPSDPLAGAKRVGDVPSDFLAGATRVQDAPDDRNGIQKAFDNLTTVTPEQEKGHSPLVNRLQEFGAGVIGTAEPLIHPVQAYEGVKNAVEHPSDAAKGVWASAKEDPWKFGAETLGNLVGSALTAGAGDEALSAIPSRGRAVNTLNSIEKQAANVPVGMQETTPALVKFGEHVSTGGKNAPVMNLLGDRIGDPSGGAINFPEARRFYTNVTDVTQRPGFWRGVFEDGAEKRLRANAGPVRAALHSDIRNAADTVGRGEDYDSAIKEYARNAKLRSIGKKAVWAAAPTAAGAMGVGKAHSFLTQVFK